MNISQIYPSKNKIPHSLTSISEIIKLRKIPWLCHFTPRENLENIKKHGLQIRGTFPSMRVTDNNRADKSNAICLSISQPNKWMFNDKIKKGFDLVLLLIDPVILTNKRCFFYPYNAATKSYRYIPLELLSTPKALEDMFNETVSYQKAKQIKPQTIYRAKNLENWITTTEQAEVQCLDTIEPNNIIHIFKNNIPLTYNEIKNKFDLEVKEKASKNKPKKHISNKTKNKKYTEQKPIKNKENLITNKTNDKEIIIKQEIQFNKKQETSFNDINKKHSTEINTNKNNELIEKNSTAKETNDQKITVKQQELFDKTENTIKLLEKSYSEKETDHKSENQRTTKQNQIKNETSLIKNQENYQKIKTIITKKQEEKIKIAPNEINKHKKYNIERKTSDSSKYVIYFILLIILICIFY